MTYLDEVALEGLKLAQLDAERGALDAEKMERIDATVEEMMDNLADFEPRRWFRKVPTGEGGDRRGVRGAWRRSPTRRRIGGRSASDA